MIEPITASPTASPAVHLHESARALLDAPDADRIARIRGERWIGYTRAKQILDRLEDLLAHPKTHRMPNLLLVGETNNGKTMIASRFAKLHPAFDNPGGDGITVPVMAIQAPPTPDESRFYAMILERLFSPSRTHDNIAKKQSQTLAILRRINLRMLVVDEIHHILAGPVVKQRQFLNVVKFLGNELEIPIVGVGTKDALRAIQADPQLANRFEPTLIPRWRVDDPAYLRLLASFERMLPLRRPSNIPNMAVKLHSMTEGTIGELSTLLRRAAVQAVRTGAETINPKILDSVDWISPSERKQAARKIA